MLTKLRELSRNPYSEAYIRMSLKNSNKIFDSESVSYTHLRAHETEADLVLRGVG